nr:MAG TPA: PORTAL PROTEIN [Caudoviricetes sp.]
MEIVNHSFTLIIIYKVIKRKQFSDLKPIKGLIDDYDLMACGLLNNLQDASEYLVVVKGFQGDNLEEIIQNVKTKKHIGVDGDSGGGVEYKTVDIPYEARKIKLEIRLKQFLRKLLNVVLKEINDINGTDYQQKDVYFNFTHEIMSNAQENAQIELTKAQTEQAKISTLLSLATQLDNDTFMQQVCDCLDIDYEKIKDKLPNPDDAYSDVEIAETTLDGVV